MVEAIEDENHQNPEAYSFWLRNKRNFFEKIDRLSGVLVKPDKEYVREDTFRYVWVYPEMIQSQRNYVADIS